ncbi:MAG: hypothetical protein H0U49_12500 [Parachlamydiaceae bacterium]|nr:hypothetical protein [Parachlamydiaceae bacterium]
MEHNGPVTLLRQTNYDHFGNNNSLSNQSYGNSPKKLPSPPVKLSPGNPFARTQDNPASKTINAQPLTNQQAQLPVSPYGGSNSTVSMQSNKSSSPFSSQSTKSAINSISTNSKVSAIAVTPVSTVNNPLVSQNNSSPKAINNPQVIHSSNSTLPSSISIPCNPTSKPIIQSQPSVKSNELATILHNHKLSKNKLMVDIKSELIKVEKSKDSYSTDWKKTALSSAELEKAKKTCKTTIDTIKDFTAKSKKSEEKDVSSINEYNYRRSLLIKEIQYIFEYTYYIDCLKFGMKNEPIPVPPKLTLSNMPKPLTKQELKSLESMAHPLGYLKKADESKGERFDTIQFLYNTQLYKNGMLLPTTGGDWVVVEIMSKEESEIFLTNLSEDIALSNIIEQRGENIKASNRKIEASLESMVSTLEKMIENLEVGLRDLPQKWPTSLSYQLFEETKSFLNSTLVLLKNLKTDTQKLSVDDSGDDIDSRSDHVVEQYKKANDLINHINSLKFKENFQTK